MSAKNNPKFPTGKKTALRLPYFVTGWLLAAFAASAQEAVRNTQAGDTAAAARSEQMQSTAGQDYTFKDGDFRLLLVPSVEMDWNDNVNLSRTNALDDFILKPAVKLTATYPFTQRNLLFVDISVGYDQYFNHPNLSALELNSDSGTGLSFDLGVEDLIFNFHDWISYSQDSSQSSLAANTPNYGTFRNTAGVSGKWDMNQTVLSLGFDHQNILATSSQFNSLNHAAEMLNARAGFRVHPQFTLGAEATAAFTTYQQSVLNNNSAYTAGAYAEFRPGSAFQATLRGGFTTYQFQNTSTTNRTGNPNSWYGSLLLSHQPRESLSYTLEAGHEVQLGTQSDLVEDWYVRPSVTWKIIKNLNIVTGMFYEHGQQGLGNIKGNSRENFDWYGGQLSVQQTLTRRFTLSVIYRLTVRDSREPLTSTTANQSYNQNLIGLQLTYHPQ